MEATQTMVEDPFEEASKATLAPSRFYGEVQVNAFFAVLEKGIGRVVFDPQIHDLTKRVTAIDIALIPLPEHNMTRPVSRSMIAQSKEWIKFTLASLHECGLQNLAELNQRFAAIEFVPTGESYEKDGAKKDKTAIKFIAVFADEDACRAAYLENRAKFVGTEAPETATPASQQPANNKERETALAFLKVIVKNSAMGQSDINVISKTIESNIANYPMIANYFTINSPETMDLITKEVMAHV